MTSTHTNGASAHTLGDLASWRRRQRFVVTGCMRRAPAQGYGLSRHTVGRRGDEKDTRANTSIAASSRGGIKTLQVGSSRNPQLTPRQPVEPFEELSLSYNGGKDCLCLLVLLLACLPTLTSTTGKSPTSDGNMPRIQAMYIAPPDPFPEIEEFVADSTNEYHLDLKQYTMAMRPALDAYLADTKSIKAIFMGTRRTDPYSEHLEHFSMTDAGWPQFMRVNPMVDWHYVDIWIFLRQLDIPYCNLYNLGYTSLGGTSNTKPNPKLAIDAEGTKFRPAYDLTRDEDERLGRGR
ncbi:hypothetical protein NQ176_g9040 [Zarea fungicola]|uniref:Uncharacterized protein n=1 Tax=Zarea fungicola TaxID=93591 RepID=A0ACC1MR87_9HYPO|nr:hypothetical protein NQ176_g9040 [Lecanicillium fungicola]